MITTTIDQLHELEQQSEATTKTTTATSMTSRTETETVAKSLTLPHFEVQMEIEMQSSSIPTTATASAATTTSSSSTTIATSSSSTSSNVVFKLPAIESTIIDIPSSTTTTTTATTAASISTSTAGISSSPSSSSLSSSYDTDSSIASSTCCTRHGEHIYMERSLHVMHQQQHHHQHHHHEHLYHGAIAATATTTHATSMAAAAKATAAAAANNSSSTYKTKAKYYQKSWPIFILLISIIEITIFVYDQLTYKRRPVDVPTTLHIPTNSVFIYRPDRRLQIWRFISYMFLHANWFHLGFNVVIQLFYGIPLEVMHGSMRVCIIYLAGVFAGSLGTSVVDSDVYLVGASGGVYALLAAHLANIMLNYAQMKYAVAQLVSVIIFVFCDIGYAFYTQYLDVIEPNKAPPVSYIAHLTGALAGLTIGLLVLKNFEQRAYENVIWWLALGVYSAFTIFAIAFNLINTVTAQMMEEQGEAITQHLLHDLGVS